MTFLAKVGERLYEFDTDGDLTLARALYVQEECRSQSILEDMMDWRFIRLASWEAIVSEACKAEIAIFAA
jgi:hypothetical protein